MRKSVFLVFIILLIITVMAFIFFFHRDEKEKEHEQISLIEKKKYKIYLPTTQMKEIEIKGENSELKNLEKVIESFIANLPSPLRETQILGVYRDRENRVYVSFSNTFASAQSAKGEFFLLIALYRTIHENFTWIEDVKILINDREVENLAGHVLVKDFLKNLADR